MTAQPKLSSLSLSQKKPAKKKRVEEQVQQKVMKELEGTLNSFEFYVSFLMSPLFLPSSISVYVLSQKVAWEE